MSESRKRVDELAESSRRDHLRNVFTAAISGIPVVGGPIASLLSDYLPDWKKERVLRFIQELSDSIDSLKQQIPVEYVRTEEFAFLFEQVFERVVKDYRQEKLNAYRRFLVNACVRQDVRAAEKEYLLSLVDQLGTVHMLVLSLFWDPEAFARTHGVAPRENVYMGSLKNTILEYLQPFHFDPDVISSAVRDLDSMSLLNQVFDTLNTMMTAQGAASLRPRLTRFGTHFCEFALSEGDVA